MTKPGTFRIVSLVLVFGLLAVAFFERQFLADGWYRFATSRQVQNAVEAFRGSNLFPGPLRFGENGAGSTLTRAGVITETNKQRESFGLLPLHENEKLNKDAEIKLNDMFAQQYFEHKSPQGRGPSGLADSVGYSYLVVGENLALGNFPGDFGVVDAWMNSPGHRANILNSKYQEIGVAVGQGTFEGRKVWLAVQSFGTPSSACPAPNDSLKATINADQARIDVMQAQVQSMKAELNAPHAKDDPQSYNQKVAEYNAVVNELNELIKTTKAEVDTYNKGIESFNACLNAKA